jgi:hypothetical protein
MVDLVQMLKDARDAVFSKQGAKGLALLATGAAIGASLDGCGDSTPGSMKLTDKLPNVSYPFMEQGIYLKKGETHRIAYRPGQTGNFQIGAIRYEGQLNDQGDLAIYFNGDLLPLQPNDPLRLSINRETGEYFSVTATETIPAGDDQYGVVHLTFQDTL